MWTVDNIATILHSLVMHTPLSGKSKPETEIDTILTQQHSAVATNFMI